MDTFFIKRFYKASPSLKLSMRFYFLGRSVFARARARAREEGIIFGEMEMLHLPLIYIKNSAVLISFKVLAT
ncbi:hypothetical protein VIRA109638_06830 [Vibrio rarus]